MYEKIAFLIYKCIIIFLTHLFVVDFLIKHYYFSVLIQYGCHIVKTVFS